MEAETHVVSTRASTDDEGPLPLPALAGSVTARVNERALERVLALPRGGHLGLAAAEPGGEDDLLDRERANRAVASPDLDVPELGRLVVLGSRENLGRAPDGELEDVDVCGVGVSATSKWWRAAAYRTRGSWRACPRG